MKKKKNETQWRKKKQIKANNKQIEQRVKFKRSVGSDWDRAAEWSVAYGMGARGAKERGKQTDGQRGTQFAISKQKQQRL